MTAEPHSVNHRIVARIDRPARSVVAAFSQFYTGIVLDALGKRGAMDAALSPLLPGTRVCGPAVTSLGPDLTVRRMAIDLAEPGDVLIGLD